MKKFVTSLFCASSLFVAQFAQADIVAITDQIMGTFNDISGTGTLIDIDDEEEATITTTLLGDLRVGNNGAIAFSSVGNLDYRNQATLPHDYVFNGAESLVPFWDDLDADIGSIRWAELADRVIVQWTERPHYNGLVAAEGITFQVQVFSDRGSAVEGDILAQYLYQDVIFDDTQAEYNNGSSATVGYQTNASEGIIWSVNSPVLFDGLVLTIVAVPEPTSASILGLAALGLTCIRRRRV